jgi:hypothetical protein
MREIIDKAATPKGDDDGLFIGPPFDRGAGEVPPKAYGYAAGFGNVNALDCSGA